MGHLYEPLQTPLRSLKVIYAYIETKKTIVCELLQDVEVVMGVAPSTNKRSNRYDQVYITSCDNVKNAVIKGLSCDPCFTEEFAKQEPTLSGMLAIANDDVDFILNSFIYFSKYRSLVLDEKNDVSVLEVILHPLQNRWDNTSPNIYNVTKILDHNPNGYDEAWEYVEKQLAADGGWTIDLATRMYVNYESTSDEVKNRCVPMEEPYKLSWLNHSYDL